MSGTEFGPGIDFFFRSVTQRGGGKPLFEIGAAQFEMVTKASLILSTEKNYFIESDWF